MSPRVDQFEIGSQKCGQRGRVVSNDRQSAASLRAIQSEGSDDDISSGLKGSLQPVDIGGLIGRISQEMEGRTVMPQIVGLRWLPFRDIGNLPPDICGLVVKTLLGRIESGGRQVQNRDPPNIAVDEGINES